ncbi:MAG: OmpA family protein [Streptosporangiaceae bacterium]
MRRVITAAILALLAALVAGCGGPGPSQDHRLTTVESVTMPQVCTKNGPVVFVVGGRENSPAPVLTGSMQSAAATAVREGSAIGLVDLDGHPRMILAGAFSDPGANALALRAAEQHYLGSLTTAVERIRAAYPHADVLDALNVAGHAIRAACRHGGTIYLEDSGLQETGLVNFRQAGMLGAMPADVVSFLAHQRDLPYLPGMTVVLAGVGDTAPSQHPLSISQQDNVIAIWSAIAKAGGATSVRADPAPLSGPAPAPVPPVLLVPVPAQPVWTPPTNSSPSNPRFVFPDSGPVGFEPNTTVFRRPAAAMAALQPLARYLAANPSARIELTGTTAHWGSLTGCIALAHRRAGTVKAVLRRMGAQPGQIVTRGLGWRFPGYINDQGPDGTLLPGPAEHNRSVIVTRI